MQDKILDTIYLSCVLFPLVVPVVLVRHLFLVYHLGLVFQEVQVSQVALLSPETYSMYKTLNHQLLLHNSSAKC